MATITTAGTPVHANTRFYKGRSLSGGPGCPGLRTSQESAASMHLTTPGEG